ncbi:LIM domain kinase 1 isoform X1 [Anopheles aquasalis]|uniref:LIM domain kinase 1 isoform X1 n=1 Tax=Anopheles aquasalis TaxID=42839 RepID=UPI00215A6E53|nr:LIM domain kinase 1 isoform X1 [Anopheles aquasalis]
MDENGQKEDKNTACASCYNTIEAERHVAAVGQLWHAECFRCSVCDVRLSSWYFEKDGLLFCREDHWSKFGDRCQQCAQIISGPVMVAGDHKFHPECFRCDACRIFIGDGETYALLERSKLFCGACYKHQHCTLLDTVAKGEGISDAKRKVPHSIRLVEIPWSSARTERIRLAAAPDEKLLFGGPGAMGGPTSGCKSVRISELVCTAYGQLGKYIFSCVNTALESCCGLLHFRVTLNTDLMSLRVGDKVLEVNGTPVRDVPLENLQSMIENSGKVLQLTVEHDPHLLADQQQQQKHGCADSGETMVRGSNLESSATRCKVLNNNEREEAGVEEEEEEGDGQSSRSLSPSKLERIFRKKDEGYMSGSSRKLQKRLKDVNCNTSSNSLKDKERSSSMSRLLDEHRSVAAGGEFYDLSRTKSFRVEQKAARIFRASDLVQGELLGKGFFGQVFKVTHRVTQEVMVLKELYRVDEEAQKNFLKEVAVLRSLSHNNVLRFIGVLYKDKKLHLVTEFIPGGSLKELIHDSGLPLSWLQRMSFARDIARGMSYLHSMNIIHRDLNSLNCLVREDGTVIVADFGLARIIKQPFSTAFEKCAANGSTTGTIGRRAGGRPRRQRYTVVGNPYWMAPEMMRGNKYDEKVDIFSFGIMLCEIIGRVQADPDYLPRLPDFGLNQTVFREKFCGQCPEPFYRIAFLCCDLNPDKRPPFHVLEVWLETMATVTAIGKPLPAGIVHEIEHFKGQLRSADSSLCTTPDGLATPPPSSGNLKPSLSRKRICEGPEEVRNVQSKGMDVVDGCCKTPTNEEVHAPSVNHVVEPVDQKTPTNGFVVVDSNELPKSPHLGKDFSANGDRIRDSIRAKRRQRMMLSRENQRKSLDSSALVARLGCDRLTNEFSIDSGGDEGSASEPISLIMTTNDLMAMGTTDAAVISTPPPARERLSTDQVLASVKDTLERSGPLLLERDRGEEEIPDTVSATRTKHYGEKGYIIQLKNGHLTLNNVRDLENCSDFDSSCDTSLNYIEVNGNREALQEQRSGPLGTEMKTLDAFGNTVTPFANQQNGYTPGLWAGLERRTCEKENIALDSEESHMIVPSQAKATSPLAVIGPERNTCSGPTPVTDAKPPAGKVSSAVERKPASPTSATQKAVQYTRKLFRSNEPSPSRPTAASPVTSTPAARPNRETRVTQDSEGVVKTRIVGKTQPGGGSSMFTTKQKISPTSDPEPQPSFGASVSVANNRRVKVPKSGGTVIAMTHATGMSKSVPTGAGGAPASAAASGGPYSMQSLFTYKTKPNETQDGSHSNSCRLNGLVESKREGRRNRDEAASDGKRHSAGLQSITPSSRKPPISVSGGAGPGALLRITKSRTFKPAPLAAESKPVATGKLSERYTTLQSPTLSSSGSNSRTESPSPPVPSIAVRSSSGGNGTVTNSRQIGILSPASIRRLNERLLEARKGKSSSTVTSPTEASSSLTASKSVSTSSKKPGFARKVPQIGSPSSPSSTLLGGLNGIRERKVIPPMTSIK